MHVKIIKATLNSYWYRGEIGKIYKVEKSPILLSQYVILEGRNTGKHLKINDCCEVVLETDLEKVIKNIRDEIYGK